MSVLDLAMAVFVLVMIVLLLFFVLERIKHKSALSNFVLTNSRLEGVIVGLREELQPFKDKYKDVDGLEIVKASIGREIEELTSKRKQILAETNALTERLTSEYENYRSKRESLVSDISALELQQANVREKVTVSLSTQERLSASIESLNDEVKELAEKKVELENAERALVLMKTELDTIRANHDRLVRDSDHELKRLNDEYVSAKRIFDEMTAEVQKLDEHLEVASFGVYAPHYDYDTPEAYKVQLDKMVSEAVEMVKDDRAIVCDVAWTVDGSKTKGKQMIRRLSKLMLRAFNGECDAAVLKVRWNNVLVMEERISRVYVAINKLGESQSIIIADEYLNLKVQQLRLAYEYQEKLHEQKEEQRRIREQLREEERSIREIRKARLEAEKEEERYIKALEKAKAELAVAKEAEIIALKDQVLDLETNLKRAQELKYRAISMAQITKAGHVYIISNIGSFGDDVYKIGMTRRIEPSDRVRELSGASVPFGFDIHAMIYSENAPELESKFHKKFAFNRLNLINARKEFFNVTLSEVEEFAHENGYQIEFTMLAEARDYRQTSSIRNTKSKKVIESMITRVFPDNLLDDLDEDDDEYFQDLLRNSEQTEAG